MFNLSHNLILVPGLCTQSLTKANEAGDPAVHPEVAEREMKEQNSRDTYIPCSSPLARSVL